MMIGRLKLRYLCSGLSPKIELKFKSFPSFFMCVPVCVCIPTGVSVHPAEGYSRVSGDVRGDGEDLQ